MCALPAAALERSFMGAKSGFCYGANRWSQSFHERHLYRNVTLAHKHEARNERV